MRRVRITILLVFVISLFAWPAYAGNARAAADPNRLAQNAARAANPANSSALSPRVFVANTQAECGSHNPCFFNGEEDLPDGVGTGLRQAVEEVDVGGEINIIGDYAIKGNRVTIDKVLTLQGLNDASLTYNTGGEEISCTQGMLLISAGVTLRDLNIDDGPCSSPNRNLIEINSPSAVLIEFNDLTSGGNAITVADNSGAVTIRYNHITGNTGFAVFSESANANGSIEIIANNLHSNGTSGAIQCSSSALLPVPNRKANHNYFGASVPTSASSNCTIDPAKRLGAPINLRTNLPGVMAQRVEVTETRRGYFDNSISVSHTGGSDFPLYIIDHGYLNGGAAPFTFAAGLDSPNPCSNYWDVFLPDGVTPEGSLNLSIRYATSTTNSFTCETVIESNQYCGQTNAALYPLFWYDPSSPGVTGSWDPTSQRPEKLTTGEGQATSCNTATNEITTVIDGSGRPALNTDLNFTPFFVGIPVLRTFQPLASSQTVTVTWTTNNEPDISGFYVLRSLDGANFSAVSDFITRRGGALQGISNPPYTYTNSNLTNGVTYYYRLQIMRSDGQAIYSDIKAVIANVATVSPTPTVTQTRTITPIPPTLTPSRTFVPQQFPTLIPSITPTGRKGLETADPDTLGTAYPIEETPGDMDETRIFEQALTIAAGGTPVAMLPATQTPSITASPPIFPEATLPVDQTARPWRSLGLGMLVGTLIVGSLAWWWSATKLR